MSALLRLMFEGIIMPKVPDAVRTFAPEQWGTVDYFKTFYETTFNFKPTDKRATSGVSAHFNKAQYLVVLAHKLKPNLEIDATELEENGYSPVHNSYELGTVVEAAILELYSVIDCTVKVIRAVHGKTSRGFKDSTRGLFEKVDEITGTIPEEIREEVKHAHWFERLRRIRDEITHLTPGSCHFESDTKIVNYMHVGIVEHGKILVIEDIFNWIDEMMRSINYFIGLVFHYLSVSFENKPVPEMCGMVEGRALLRYLRPVGSGERITFDSGECASWVWFEKEDLPTCPFAQACGAYKNKAAPEGWET
jgi:uncharacterized protein with HEPN domain